jgi:hypothetical protein
MLLWKENQLEHWNKSPIKELENGNI